jgi:glutathione S-transferase
MTMATLYYSTNLNPRVAVAVARHLKSPVEFIRASPRDPRFEDAFRSINPNTLVPVLVQGDKSLWETDAIACRLCQIAGSDFWATGDLLPETVKWLSWSTHHLTAAGGAFYFENIIKPQYLGLPPDSRIIEEVEGNFHRYAKVLDDILASRRWLIGDRLTYADFRAATIMPFAKDAKMPVDGYKNILEWAGRLDQIDAWRAPFDGLH